MDFVGEVFSFVPLEWELEDFVYFLEVEFFGLAIHTCRFKSIVCW